MAEQLVGKVEPIEIEEEMKSSYIDYAMSVIVGRALPDARDGLKPAHRRILYAMYDMGMLPGRPFKKCARIVGEVLGKYHPHGDMAVYDTLVRMAQDFSHRYELIEGYGNFGSIDGDNAAAMRYTEARLAKLSMELLRDIEKETVDFAPNFDETLSEPEVLPARFPNLLVNGSAGIAVGMATNIPPHNLGEAIDATIMLIDKPSTPVKELMKAVKGPDFPTGGIIMGKKGIKNAYETGRGSITVRGRAEIEEAKGGRHRIIVTEIPYQVVKARMAEKIADLVKEDKLREVADLRDESDRTGMRLVVELKREAVPQIALNKLYKHTQLEVTFGIIMLALVDGVPRTLSLAGLLSHYIDYQKEVVIRRTKYELKKAEERAHILTGLLVAIKNLDATIKLIRSSETPEEAKEKLMKKFSLTDIQAQAILDMRLQRLTGLEREKVELEYQELIKRIKELKSILASEKKVLGIVKKELLEVKEKYADARRTKLKAAQAEMDEEDLIAKEDMVITVTHSGYIKRQPVSAYKRQRRGGRGISGTSLKEEDFIEHLFIATTHHYILFFSNRGKVYRLKVHELPLGTRQSKGRAIVNILPFRSGEKIAAIIATPDFGEGLYLTMATKNGLAKKTPLTEYDTSRREGLIAINLRGKDELIGVKLTKGKEDIILVSRLGLGIRFNETQIRPMGRAASGVKGIRLAVGDEVLGMEVAFDEADIVVITEKGFGKRTPVSKYPKQSRGGKGVKTIKLGKGKGKVAGAKTVKDDYELMIASREGVLIRVPASGISRQGRQTQGVKVMNIKSKDNVSALARVIVSKKKEEEEPGQEQLPTKKPSKKA